MCAALNQTSTLHHHPFWPLKQRKISSQFKTKMKKHYTEGQSA
jgi:hypothetical protein